MPTTSTKTIAVAVYPDGTERTIVRTGRMYTVPYPAGHPFYYGHGVQTMADVRRYVEEAGGRIERRPNPRYRERPLPLFSQLMREGGFR